LPERGTLSGRRPSDNPFAVLHARRGKDGGGAELTSLGAEIVTRYRRAVAKIERNAAAESRSIEEHLSISEPAPPSAPTSARKTSRAKVQRVASR
jgi:molybdenum-dependent DNA-binding transcriptional regulator ModE